MGFIWVLSFFPHPQLDPNLSSLPPGNEILKIKHLMLSDFGLAIFNFRWVVGQPPPQKKKCIYFHFFSFRLNYRALAAP